jgi:ATP:ADP antiporter, AAA family
MSNQKYNVFFARIAQWLNVGKYDAIKIFLSAATFFFIIGSYSILRSFKTSIFLGFVGREYEPYAKIVAILVTIPVMLIYGRVIDKVKKHQAIYCFLGLYIVLTILFACLFAHPVHGIANTQTSPYRIIGWMFEIFMDLFQALIVSTFWSFLNSISTPAFANRSYGLVVAGSRLGGILTTFFCWCVLEKTSFAPTISIPLLTAVPALLLFCAGYCIYLMKRIVPAEQLHGYEATYQIEHNNEKNPKTTGVFEGLRLMLTEPYVLGIFGLVFSFEIINIIFDYQMHILMSIEKNNEVLGMSSFMLLYTGTFQTLSLLFSLFGTSTLLKRFGVRNCLLVMPIASMGLALLPVMYPKLITVFIVMVILRALNYGFNHPLREILFIPTVKDIQFKSKAWIDSFGRTISKTTGSTFNLFANTGSAYFTLFMQSSFSIAIASVWAFIAILIGKRYLQTIAQNDVIGKKR